MLPPAGSTKIPASGHEASFRQSSVWAPSPWILVELLSRSVKIFHMPDRSRSAFADERERFLKNRRVFPSCGP